MIFLCLKADFIIWACPLPDTLWEARGRAFATRSFLFVPHKKGAQTMAQSLTRQIGKLEGVRGMNLFLDGTFCFAKKIKKLNAFFTPRPFFNRFSFAQTLRLAFGSLHLFARFFGLNAFVMFFDRLSFGTLFPAPLAGFTPIGLSALPLALNGFLFRPRSFFLILRVRIAEKCYKKY
jgi:hypothetical protein